MEGFGVMEEALCWGQGQMHRAAAREGPKAEEGQTLEPAPKLQSCFEGR